MKTKKKQILKRFDDAKPVKEINNKAPLNWSASFVFLNCEVCGLEFGRKASEVKRNAHSYCGRACFGLACRKQVDVNCKVCNLHFTTKQSMKGRVTCCSEECRSIARSIQTSAMNHELWKKGVFGDLKNKGQL